MPHLPLTPENGQEVLPPLFSAIAYLICLFAMLTIVIWAVVRFVFNGRGTRLELLLYILTTYVLTISLIVATVLILKHFLI